MTIMAIFFSIVLPCILMVGVVLLRPLRLWLEAGARRVEIRAQLIEEYHTNAMTFLKTTDPETHSRSREVVTSIGDMMMNGTKLIRAVLFVAKIQPGTDAYLSSEASNHMSDLSDEARHALARSLGAALLVSTFQSHFFGRRYRSILELVLRDNNKEVKEPEQLIYRFGRANSLLRGANTPSC